MHLHLLLNHFPVIGMFMVTALLGVALMRKSSELGKVALGAVVVLAVISVIVYLTGEPAEDAIENVPGFSKAVTERHEEFALIATIVVGVIGAIALALLRILRRQDISQSVIAWSFALSIAGSAMMGYTAMLGGQVRHTEIRPAPLHTLKVSTADRATR
jgi:uncharacterized membrane protein